jgi:hypothetical protein
MLYCKQRNVTLAINFFTCIMFGLKVICWALLFIFKLRFPPDVSIATVLKSRFHSPSQQQFPLWESVYLTFSVCTVAQYSSSNLAIPSMSTPQI